MLIGEDHKPLASGSYDWENQYVDQIWTYSLEDIWRGLQGCYQELNRCLEAISDYIEACSFGDQRNDAWVYGI